VSLNTCHAVQLSSVQFSCPRNDISFTWGSFGTYGKLHTSLCQQNIIIHQILCVICFGLEVVDEEVIVAKVSLVIAVLPHRPCSTAPPIKKPTLRWSGVVVTGGDGIARAGRDAKSTTQGVSAWLIQATR
jgi:hypothetical protein